MQSLEYSCQYHNSYTILISITTWSFLLVKITNYRVIDLIIRKTSGDDHPRHVHDRVLLLHRLRREHQLRQHQK